MAERRPFFQFYPADWIASTRGLSGAARGYHIDMLALAWLNGGCECDPEALRRSVGADRSEWRKVWAELAPRWREVNGRLVNDRQERVRQEADAHSAARALAGSRGGKAKASRLANHKQTPSNATASDLANDVAKTYPSPSPSHTTESSDDDSSVGARAPARPPVVSSGFPVGRVAVLEVVAAWNLAMPGRAVIESKLTPTDRSKLAAILQTWSIADLEGLFARVAASDYLTGRDGQLAAVSLWKALDLASRIAAGDFDNRASKQAGLRGGGQAPARFVETDALVVVDTNCLGTGTTKKFRCAHAPVCLDWQTHRDRLNAEVPS